MRIKTRGQWTWFSVFALLLGAGWIWMSATPSGGTTGGKIPAPQRGFMAPDFTLQTLEGEQVTLSALRGQVVLVNLWASWCGPCRFEMPAIQQVYDKYKDQGFEVLAVNATNQDSPAAAAAFAQELELSFPILLDTAGRASQAYQLRSLPSTYFIDKEGVIQEVVVGAMSEALLTVRVEQLLEEKR